MVDYSLHSSLTGSYPVAVAGNASQSGSVLAKAFLPIRPRSTERGSRHRVSMRHAPQRVTPESNNRTCFLPFKLFMVNSSCSPTAPLTVKVTVVSWLPKTYEVPKGVRMYWYLFLLKTQIMSFGEF